MPHCWGPYKHQPLVSPWTDDTGQSPSDKLSADGWIPHCTHYPPTSIPNRSSYQCSRQQMGMRRCGWSRVKEMGRGGKKPSSRIHQVFSKTNPSQGEWNTPLFIQLVPKGVIKSSGMFWRCAILTFAVRKEEGGKSNSEAKAGKPNLVEIRLLI